MKVVYTIQIVRMRGRRIRGVWYVVMVKVHKSSLWCCWWRWAADSKNIIILLLQWIVPAHWRHLITCNVFSSTISEWAHAGTLKPLQTYIIVHFRTSRSQCRDDILVLHRDILSFSSARACVVSASARCQGMHGVFSSFESSMNIDCILIFELPREHNATGWMPGEERKTALGSCWMNDACQVWRGGLFRVESPIRLRRENKPHKICGPYAGLSLCDASFASECWLDHMANTL